MALANVFQSIADWARHLASRGGKQPLQPAPGQDFTNPVDAFLYDMSDWHPVSSSHHDAVIYDIERREMSFKFNDGRVCIVSDISRDEALEYYHAGSKGGWYWDTVRVRGEGNSRLTKKPFRYAN